MRKGSSRGHEREESAQERTGKCMMVGTGQAIVLVGRERTGGGQEEEEKVGATGENASAAARGLLKCFRDAPATDE